MNERTSTSGRHCKPLRAVAVALAGMALGTATHAADKPTPGGTIVYLNYEPQTLNPYLEPEAVAGMFGKLVSRGLTDRDESGQWVPKLAQKVPSVKDGDVSADLRTVTWKLKPGLKWSDGTKLTSDDLRYTWEVCSNPKAACAKGNLGEVAAVDTPDEETIVLHYAKPALGFQGQFRQGVLPRHGKGMGPAEQIATWAWDRTLEPTAGPFMVKSWDAGQGMTLVRNPNFDEPGKPYLDGINAVFKNDTQTMLQALMGGQADMSTWLTIPAPEQLKQAKDAGMTFGDGVSEYLNEIQLNLRDPKDVSKPHPILGDVKVRKAILLGLNVDEILANWDLPGFYKLDRVTSHADLDAGWECKMPPLKFDRAASMKLLEEAGWKLGANGIRTKDGKPMRLRVGTYTGFNLEPNVVVMQSELKKLGVDALVENTDTQVLYSSWTGNSPMYLGDFDILFFDWSRDTPDLQADFEGFFSSKQIASKENPTGRNSGGVDDPQIDAWLAKAATLTDDAGRKALYCKTANRVQNELYSQEYTSTYSNWPMSQPKLKGWKQYERQAWFGAGVENWYLEH